MKTDSNLRSRVIVIGLAVVLLAVAVFLVGTSLQQDRQTIRLDEPTAFGSPSVPEAEKDFSETAALAAYLKALGQPAEPRTLADYYSRRAYSGAPPTVPHPIDPQSFGGSSCLQCHQTGDFVPALDSFAPIVPHPELTSCNSCHVTVESDDLFVESDWQKAAPAQLNRSALLTSPPPIPHGVQFRENCVSCHAPPSAPAEIHFTHPERESCTQCHVYIEAQAEWER